MNDPFNANLAEVEADGMAKKLVKIVELENENDRC